MYLIYLDESGTGHENDENKIYCLGGLVVREVDWTLIDSGVQNIKKQYKYNESHELHIRRFYTHNKKSITNNNKSIPRAIINATYDLIADSPLILFCMHVDRSDRNPDTDVEFEAWEYLVNRLNICVDKQCKKFSNDEFGLLIMDEKGDDKDLRIRDYLRKLRDSGTQYQIINRLIEDPLFTVSDWRNLTQLADAVVCCCRFQEEPFFKTQFEKIKNKFDKDKNGNIYNFGYKSW
jgi:hypothetical protein